MGKSAASCFKIITCGGDSVDHDDLQTSQSKGSSDRRGWGIRKRSARNRVLSNSVISEAPFSANKENPESTTAVNFQEQNKSTVPEKSSVTELTDGKSLFSNEANSTVSDAVAARDDNAIADVTLDEPTITFIQAAIRGFLAQRVLVKHKNIIKLQAAVRGHLVRKHAVGTLRCVQAIVKMQILVRARRAHRRLEEYSASENESGNHGNDNQDSARLGMSKAEARPKVTASIQKLLSNGFARQLLDSTPRTKPINIKCDPLKSDSAWKWLEMWMSVSMMGNEGSHKSADAEKHEEEKQGYPDRKEDTVIPSECYSESVGIETGIEALSVATEGAANMDLQSCKETVLSPSQKILPESQNFDESNTTYKETDSLPIQLNETNLASELDSKSNTGKPEREHEQDVPNDEEFSTKKPESELPEPFDESNTMKDISVSLPIQLNETELLVKVEPESHPGKVEREYEQDMQHQEKLSTETREHEQDVPDNEEKFSTKKPETELPEPFDESNTTKNVYVSLSIQLNETDPLAKVEPESHPVKTEREYEQDIQYQEKLSTMKHETEAKKISYGSSRESNPSFLDAQLKFEELSSATNTLRSTSFPTQDPAVECNIEKISSVTDQQSESGEIGFPENSIYQASVVQDDTSGCGTELVITSASDSPDISEVKSVEFEMKQKFSDGSAHPKSNENLEIGSSKPSAPMNVMSSITDRIETDDDLNSANGECASLTGPTDSAQLEKKPDTDPSKMQMELGSEASHQICKSSPGASPRNQNTIFESHEKPSMQMSDETDHLKSSENLEVEGSNDKPTATGIDLLSTNSDKLETDEGINSANCEGASLIICKDSDETEKKPDTDPSKTLLELGSEASHQANGSSPEASSSSSITVSEPQATPSTPVSKDPNKIRGQKSEPKHKSRSVLAGKGSPSTDHDSVASSSVKLLTNEHKTGKRRKSFGSARPDHVDQEPKHSSSSNSLPSYMQATESARAKAIANRSPRSSPDINDKETYVKKRHSLEGGNERQGSPSIQRSMSQAQKNSPGNGIHSPQERRWRR